MAIEQTANMPLHGTAAAPDEQGALRRLLRELRAWAEWQHLSGARELPLRGRCGRAEKGRTGAESEEKTGLDGVRSLEELRAWIGDCRRCRLAEGRTHLVFGVGNPKADLMFVGEGPGRDEDLAGEPFVGRAGQLLTDIITRGMKLRREDVYIANVVKCRPPNNRNPQPDEIEACLPFLVRQVELVRPRVIVALGKIAAQALLGVTTPISRLRGQWHEFHGVPVMPTYHPAYLLRNPADKKLVWQDIQEVMRKLGLKR